MRESASCFGACLAWLLLFSLAVPSLVSCHISVDRTLQLSLAAETTVYCNITSDCKPCKHDHINSEICRPTAHTERLACSIDANTTHQVAVRLHRRAGHTSQLLHTTRSCWPKDDATATSNSGAAAVTEHAADAVNFTVSSSSATGSTAAAATAQDSVAAGPQTGQLQLSTVQAGPIDGPAGLSLLYFELAMLVVLSGSLPVVYLRKRRYVRL